VIWWLRHGFSYLRLRRQGKSHYEAIVLADPPIFYSEFDEVEMHNRAMSPEEIAEDYDQDRDPS
jgi:hypothetical protein